MNITRREDESALDHHKRIVYGKLKDKTLADYDYTELAEQVYGKPYSSDVARRMMYGSCKTLQLFDSEDIGASQNEIISSDIEQKIVELKKERQKFFDQRNALNKIIRDRARQEELNDIIRSIFTDGYDEPFESHPINIQESDNDLLVSLNDIHYGIVVDNAWTKYNPIICARMMRLYAAKIIQIAERHGSENCYIFNNGDSISGSIHKTIQIANKENVVEQVKGVSRLIANFINTLSYHFKNVYFVSVAGNHSRLDSKDDACHDERMDDLIEWYLESKTENLDNVYIGNAYAGYLKLDESMYLLDIRGKTYCGVHGDYDDTPSKIQSLQSMLDTPVYAVLLGHKHHNKTDKIQGTKTVMAGSFLGTDDYCVQKRIFGEPEQMVCVCDKNGIVCHYDIALN